MLLISIKIWLFEMGFEHILLKELMYLSSFGLFSHLSISTKPRRVFTSSFVLILLRISTRSNAGREIAVTRNCIAVSRAFLSLVIKSEEVDLQ